MLKYSYYFNYINGKKFMVLVIQKYSFYNIYTITYCSKCKFYILVKA